MPTTSELRKFLAPEIVYGARARNMVDRYAQSYFISRPLVVSDPGVMEAGWTGSVIRKLEEMGLGYTLFAGVSPNPRDEEVHAGARVYADEKCDSIIAVGGGSPMDCAKGIGIVSASGRSVLDFEGVDKVDKPGPPLVCIPTTAGSSADVSQFAIITDTERKVKIAIVSKAVVPDVALVDPECTTTMDPRLTAATGMDALAHAVEAYVSLANSSITDALALKAMGLIRAHLVGAIENPLDMDHRGGMMNASMLAGLAFSNAILGAVHAMAHSLGGLSDLPHGDCNAILLAYVAEANFDACPDRYRDVAQALGADTRGKSDQEAAQALSRTILDLRSRAGISHTLSSLGIRREDLPALARTAMEDACMLTNPKKLTVGDIEGIYAQAL